MSTKSEQRKERVENAVREMADQFITALEQGLADPTNWEAPWHNMGGMFPTNAKTGNRYQGVNAWSLSLRAGGGGWWATYRQWNELGGQVRKGEKGATILVPKPIKIKEEDDNGVEVEKRIMLFGTAVVFHSSQQDGWEAPEPPARAVADEPAPAFDAWEESVVARSGIGYREVAEPRAYYSPKDDRVTLPTPAMFKSDNQRRATLAHEFGHATGHADRLNRPGITQPISFGSETYAREELVAELTAATLGVELGVATELRDDHRDYLAGWIKALRDDPRVLLEASKDAQAAANWLLEVAEDKEAAA